VLMKDLPLIIGHRGYRARFPENTLLAFSEGFKHGADGLECDVQKTKDGVYIIYHDEELLPLTGKKGTIGQTSYKELKKIKIKGQSIPSLKELLDFIPENKFINIELKEETLSLDDAEKIAHILKNHKAFNNILISSFKHELLVSFKKNGFKIGLLFEDFNFDNRIFPPLLRVIKYRPWSVNLPIKEFTKNTGITQKLFILLMRLLAIKIIFWTVNTTEDFDAVYNYSYGIITDHVELLLNHKKTRNHNG